MIVRTQRVTLHLDDAPVDLRMVACPSDAVRIAREVIGDCHTEVILGLWCNARQRVTGFTEIARGTVNSTRLQPRDVFTPALLVNAASFILAHNHPSGDPAPSSADRLVTHTLRSTGELLGLTLLDHVIVTRDRWFSFRDAEEWL